MTYKIFADIIVVIHFVWILFMLVGFIFIVGGFWWRGIFDRWLFRTLHLGGIVYVSLLAVMGRYCPLTIWENTLRAKYDPALIYPGSFIVHYIKMLVYPDVNPPIILVPTVIIAISTILLFIIKPPAKLKEKFKKFQRHNA